MQYHKYSLTELENMMPWERDIYTSLLEQYIEEENLKRQQEEGVRKYGYGGRIRWSKSKQFF